MGEVNKLDFAAIDEFLNRDAAQPHCLVFASHEPHLPWNQGDPSRYDAEHLRVPSYLVDAPETRQGMTRYYAEIESLDGEVGRCMDLVRAAGQEENTLFAFSSEQGAQFPGAKWTCWELGLHEGVHTTRGILEGADCYAIRSIRDERYKLIWNLNADSEFRNVLIIGDAENYWRSWVAKAETDENSARLVGRYLKRPEWEFYDLAADPLEMHNLAAAAEHGERIDALRVKLEAWMRQQGDEGIATEMLVRPSKRSPAGRAKG